MAHEEFVKEIVFEPAFDRTSEGYGIRAVSMRWLLKGSKGVMQFLVFTGWHLPLVGERLFMNEKDLGSYNPFAPVGADVGYHSPEPMYKGQEQIMDSCPYLDGKPCYYDGSGLAADRLLNLLIEKGGDAVWENLEQRYYTTFYPDDEES